MSAEPLDHIKERYQTIIAQGEAQTPPPDPLSTKKQGRMKKSKSRNLLERLRDHQSHVLAFANFFRVPFDNHLSEREIRIIKIKIKISGMFKTMPGAETFCRLRSYMSTARKNYTSIMPALRGLFQGTPFRPAAAPG